jgi:hypothetical protein
VAEIPESILRRSAEARAKKEGRPVEEVLAEMKGEAPPAPAAEPATPAAPAASGGGGGGAGLPESILRRSAEARAKAEGRSVEDVLAEMKGEAPAPAAAPAATPAAAAAPAAAPQGGGPVRDLAAESQQYGVPAPLLRRAALARAKWDNTPAPTFAGEAPAPAPVAAAVGGAAPATAPAAAPAIPEGVRTQRLLTVVKAGAIQQVKSEPTDKVNTWPHLIAAEFVALMVVTAALLIFSVFVDAPLLEFANFNEQPNPSKAPWYFLGLQELLSYFDPQVAGVIIPGFGLGGLAIIPYIDRNPSVRPSDRKLAIMIFSFFLFASAILTIYGSFFRGPGFNFTFPWVDGIFFDF